jgi:hypothetical protein
MKSRDLPATRHGLPLTATLEQAPNSLRGFRPAGTEILVRARRLRWTRQTSAKVASECSGRNQVPQDSSGL